MIAFDSGGQVVLEARGAVDCGFKETSGDQETIPLLLETGPARDFSRFGAPGTSLVSFGLRCVDLVTKSAVFAVVVVVVVVVTLRSDFGGGLLGREDDTEGPV